MLPGPTVPSRPVRRSGLSQRAFSRGGNRDRSRPRILRSPSGPKPFRFPRWLPAQGRSPGGSPLGGSELAFLFPPWRSHEPKHLKARPAGSSAEASVPPDMVMSRSPGSMPGSQLPGRNPVLPDPSEAEAPSEPVAARSPEGIAFCRAGPRSEDPVSGLAGLPLARRPSGDRMGAVRNLPLSHTLKGKPVLVR